MSSLGASGALFAMLGIVGISFPNTQLGIILIPGSLPITQALACIALFDAIGIFVRYPYLRLGHASHLSGLAVGVAYAKYGGDKKIWRPGRKLVFSAMRSLGVL
jgi:rhomboid-like protein